MPVYLVTGRGGSGKSTVAEELQRRGYTAFDGDDLPGLSRSEDAVTGEPVIIDYSKYFDPSKTAWNWQVPVLEEFLAAHTGNTAFLCGSASNELDFHRRFDKVFVLTLHPDTHAERLRTRASEYGKEPRVAANILAEQPVFVEQAAALGAITIDADGTLQQTVDSILRHVDAA
jgi:broad-specificity NMP kinase